MDGIMQMDHALVQVTTSNEESQVTPEFFLAHYMQFVCMAIARGNPSEDTRETYRKNIDAFLGWCLGTCGASPFSLKERHIELYRAFLLSLRKADGTRCSNSFVHVRLSAVRAFYKAAVKQGLMDSNPCLDVKAPTDALGDLPFNYYSMAELRELVHHVKGSCDEFERCRSLAMIYLMAVAGLRCIEVHRADREDINWSDCTMRVHGKGHDGTAYLDESTASVLRDYLDCIQRLGIEAEQEGGRTPLIISRGKSRQGTRLARNSIRWNMSRLLEGANLKTCGSSCHVLRHSCATALYEATRDLRVVQDTMRHRDPKVTARYAHVVEQLCRRPTATLGRSLE